MTVVLGEEEPKVLRVTLHIESLKQTVLKTFQFSTQDHCNEVEV